MNNYEIEIEELKKLVKDYSERVDAFKKILIETRRVLEDLSNALKF